MLKYFKSRTVTFNSLILGLSALTVVVESQIGYLREAVPVEYWPYVMGGMFVAKAVVDLYLRSITTKPLTERKEE